MLGSDPAHRRSPTHEAPTPSIASSSPLVARRRARRRLRRPTGGLGSVPSAGARRRRPIRRPGRDARTSTRRAVEPSTRRSIARAGATPAADARPASPGETMIVRAYFFLGGEPGSAGLVPVLREVPQTPAVATAAMNALLAGPTATESGERPITIADPRRHPPARPDDQERRRDRRPVDASSTRAAGARRCSTGCPGRLHADPVPDGPVGRLPDRGPDR